MNGHQIVQLFVIGCGLVTTGISISTILTLKKSNLSNYRIYKSCVRTYRSLGDLEQAAECEAEAARALRHAWPYKPEATS